MSRKKQKKEKIIYYDDNSTIADMSSVNKKGTPQPPPEPKRYSTGSQKWRTYWNAVKMMFFPMCVVLLVLAGLYLVLMLMTGNLF
ncbi:MAG: OadG family protein [Clostridia bacterium]|nr:OadG family protein [Clostridia bacterium]